MRELKFRVWDKIHEKYREPMVYDISHEKIVVRLPIETLKKGEFLLEQYTGLKDKNGNEIYEGDIVKAGGRIYEVDWLEKDGGWFCFTEDDYYTPLYHLETEVIGNIHENPELLEKEEE